MRTITALFIFVLGLISLVFGEPVHRSEIIFPFQEKHVHGSSMVCLPNGDFLACWFHGSGERTADDVVIQGARLKKGQDAWSDVFLMADTPGLPDCNPVLFLDQNNRLWLFWIAIRANGWEHSVLRYRFSDNYDGKLAPEWLWQDIIILKPGESFVEHLRKGFEKLNPPEDMWAEYAPPYTRLLVDAARDKNKRQEGWMTRIHPLQLQGGRILLPLYSDGFNVSLIAISDDEGKTWRASDPIVGLAGIQPTLVQKRDGTIVAFMRDTGGAPYRVLRSQSKDRGETWTVMQDTDIPNPGSSLEVIALNDEYWAMIYNDSEENRNSMAIALSDDEGESWNWKRSVGSTDYYAYPSMLQDDEGLIHITYTYRTQEGKTIKHEVFNVEWQLHVANFK